VRAYLAYLAQAIRPHVTSTTYVNFLDLDGATPECVRAAYSSDDWARLVQLKYRYDPHNVFRFNRNVPPGGHGPRGASIASRARRTNRRFTVDPGNAAGTANGRRSVRSETVDPARTLHEEGAIMHNDYTSGPGPDLVGCPACAAPAEVVDRYALESTDGPIEHATVVCALRHRFTVLVERLATHAMESERERWARAPHSSTASQAR
jgi:hypothetical protein